MWNGRFVWNRFFVWKRGNRRFVWNRGNRRFVWNRRFGLESSLRLESSLGNVVALRNRRLSPQIFMNFCGFKKVLILTQTALHK